MESILIELVIMKIWTIFLKKLRVICKVAKINMYFFSHINKIKKLTYEYCTILLYKSLQKDHPAITIMDGPFFTLYPWDNKKNFGLYSVVRSRLLIDKNLNSFFVH